MKLSKDLKRQGFSLIELAIVLAIAGLILAALLSAYNQYQARKGLEDTQARMNSISAAIMLFYSENGRYPCPASHTLSVNDANSGKESCPAATPAIGSCDSGICRAAGARDVGGDGNPDPVLIGTVPYKDLNISLNLSMQNTFDGYGQQFTYAVTEALTDQLTFDETAGAIGVTSETGISVITPADSGHVVIVSHGPDAKGGYTPEGLQARACAAGQMDGENCDDDANFIAGIRSMGSNADYYDDMVRFALWKVTTLWTQSPLNPNDIYNRNPGNVGIGTDTPTERLDVNGNVKAIDMQADRFCDVTGGDCFPADTIGGSGISCSSGQAMTGIAYNSAVCDPLTFPSGVTPGTCPSGQFVAGIDASGNIVCASP